jgi:hypothetical protein
VEPRSALGEPSHRPARGGEPRLITASSDIRSTLSTRLVELTGAPAG